MDDAEPQLVGADEDEYGCISSAGFQWCNATQECERPWEKPCASSGMIVGNDRDEHGCIATAGYTWCEATSQCQRKWVEPCESDSDAAMLGEDRDIYGCITSAGYSWCEGEKRCYRSWEDTCSDAMELVGDDRDDHGCIGTAGYSWCEDTQECVRPWEVECASLMNGDMPTTTESIEKAAEKVLRRISVGGWIAIAFAILAICAVVVAVTVMCTRRRTQKQCEEASVNYKELLVENDGMDTV